MDYEQKHCRILGLRHLQLLLANGLFLVFALLVSLPHPAIAAPANTDPVVLAVVNDEPITDIEFNKFFRAKHRGRDAQSSGARDFSKLLDDLIDNRLVLQEGVRMGLDQEPDVKNLLELRGKSAAGDLLIRREVKERVQVSEEEIKDSFSKIFQKINVRQIVVKERSEAEAVLAELGAGADFSEVAQKKSIGPKAKEGGNLGTFPLYQIYAPLEQTVLRLKVGEVSEIVASPKAYHILRIEEKTPADPKYFPHVKERVEARLRKRLEQKRKREFVSLLRKAAKISIHSDRIEPIGRTEVLRGAPKDVGEVVAQVDGTAIPMGYYWKALNRRMRLSVVSEEAFKKVKNEVLDDLAERVLVRKEAEKRNLTSDPEVLRQVEDLRRRLVMKKIVTLMILPKINANDENLRSYYGEHQEMYRNPDEIRLARVVVSSTEKAAEIQQRLKAGEDFAWIVKHESEDEEHIVKKGGDLGWTQVVVLSPQVKEGVKVLPVGGVSETIKLDSTYNIYYLKDKKRGAVKSFESVKRNMKSDYIREGVNSALEEWANKLRKVSTININEDKLKRYVRKYGGK